MWKYVINVKAEDLSAHNSNPYMKKTHKEQVWSNMRNMWEESVENRIINVSWQKGSLNLIDIDI